MKMLKKLLAVVLTGAMALTLFTACGGSPYRGITPGVLFYTFRILSDFLSPFKLCLWLFSKKHRIILFSK